MFIFACGVLFWPFLTAFSCVGVRKYPQTFSPAAGSKKTTGVQNRRSSCFWRKNHRSNYGGSYGTTGVNHTLISTGNMRWIEIWRKLWGIYGFDHRKPLNSVCLSSGDLPNSTERVWATCPGQNACDCNWYRTVTCSSGFYKIVTESQPDSIASTYRILLTVTCPTGYRQPDTGSQ